MRVDTALAFFVDHDAAQDRSRDKQQHRVHQQRQRRAHQLDQRARQPGPGHLGPRRGQRVLGMRLDQALARHHLSQHDLRCAAGGGEDAADDEAHHVEPLHRQPAHPPGERHAGDDERERHFTDDVDRQLAHPVQPHAGRQREQHEGQHLHRCEQAHLRGRGVQQHGGRQRQREHRHLTAERADQDRCPQPPVGGVAQQVAGRELQRGAQAMEPIREDLVHGLNLSFSSLAGALWAAWWVVGPGSAKGGYESDLSADFSANTSMRSGCREG